MIDASTVAKAKFFPELLPGTDFYTNIGAGLSASPAPLDLRQLGGRVVELVDLSLNSHADIEFEVKFDRRQQRLRTLALNAAQVYPYSFMAGEMLSYNLFNVGAAPVANVRTMYGVWVSRPTVADKLKFKWLLNPTEQSIADELGIQASVEKGVLPLPRNMQLEREYQILRHIVYPVTLDVPVSPNTVTVLQVTVEASDEFAVLRKIACSDVDVAHNVALTLKRDTDEAYITVKAPALGNIGSIDCWIPALQEIKLDASAAQASAGVSFLLDVLICRMTNTLRARWQLVPDEALPADVPKKVKGGVL